MTNVPGLVTFGNQTMIGTATGQSVNSVIKQKEAKQSVKKVPYR
jgi:hypothetical protein